MIQTNSTTTCLYLYDAIGNPVALTTGGYTSAFDLRYDPYGAATRIDTAGNTNGCNDNPYGFRDGIKDRVTGDVKFGARWYNQPNGVWAQQDTLNAPSTRTTPTATPTPPTTPSTTPTPAAAVLSSRTVSTALAQQPKPTSPPW